MLSTRRTVRWSSLLVALALASPALQAQRGADPVRRRAVDPALGSPRLYPVSASPTPGRAAARRRGIRPAIVLTGYWPPSNEAIRPFNHDPAQNPGGWIGRDWEGRGYDVYAFFPEFNPQNCGGACGRGTGHLEVDYQDTVADFWPIVERLDPVAVITFSRGADDSSWELEMNQFNRFQWGNDFQAPTQPTPAPPDSSLPGDALRPSMLPVQAIVDALNHSTVPVVPFVCYSGNGGGFVSEFIAYLGVWYQSLHSSQVAGDFCAAAGHVHVGGQLSWTAARDAVFVTLRTVMNYVDQVTAMPACQTDLGYARPGLATLSMCGAELSSGNQAELSFTGAPPTASAWLLVGPSFRPTPWMGGHVVPLPARRIVPFQADASGSWTMPGIAGGGGPLSLYMQAVYLDAALPRGVGITNALRVDWLP